MSFRGVYAIIGLGFLVLAFCVWYGVQEKETLDVGALDILNLTIGGAEVITEVANTPELRQKGLSGRLALPEGSGMLFVFSEPSIEGFWMPDMHFSIDIIWLDQAFTVVHSKENATPESYPEVFAPPVPASYVLEVPTGFVRKFGIKNGMSAHIETKSP